MLFESPPGRDVLVEAVCAVAGEVPVHGHSFPPAYGARRVADRHASCLMKPFYVGLAQRVGVAGRVDVLHQLKLERRDTLDPGCIEFEICDGEMMQKREAEHTTLQQLRKMGVRLSLDHFGTRDVSFESIDSGFIDSFVLDQALIADVEDNNSHQRIVRAAIAMAQGLDIEGVQIHGPGL